MSIKVFWPVVFSFIFMTFLLCIPSGVQAQGVDRGDSEAGETVPPDRKEEVPGLVAGNVRVVFPAQKDKKFPRGSHVFTDIKLHNLNRRRHASGELIFEADGLKVLSVKGQRKRSRFIKIRKRGKRHTVSFRGLQYNRPQTLSVQLRLNEKPDSISNLVESRLVITLRTGRNKKKLSDSASLVWGIENCASSYHSALSHLEETGRQSINDALKNTRTAIRSVSGRWLFTPTSSYTTKEKKVSKCKRYTRYWNRSKEGWSYKCRLYGTVTKEVKSLTPEAGKMKELYQSASAVVYSRGRLPEFQKNTGSYWVTRQISEDLQRYLTQKSSPVICTGALQMVSYYENKFKQVRTQSKSWKDKLVSAQKQAVLAIEVLMNMFSGENAKNFSDEKLQKISFILDSKEFSDKELFTSEQMLDNLILRLKAGKAVLENGDHKSVYDKLTAFKKNWKTYTAEHLSVKGAENKLRDTLFLIETVYHLEQVRDKYTKVILSFDLNMNGIRDAHKKHCTCFQ